MKNENIYELGRSTAVVLSHSLASMEHKNLSSEENRDDCVCNTLDNKTTPLAVEQPLLVKIGTVYF